jgi:type IV pilus assembly protein PilA
MSTPPPGQPPFGAPQQAPTSGLAIAALIFAFLLPPIGFILGIIALVQINRAHGQLKGQGLAIAALVLPVLLTFVVGVLAAIAIPNFLRYQLRSKQAEAKVNLGAIRTSQMAFRTEVGSFASADPAPSPEGIGPDQRAWTAQPCPAACARESPAGCVSFDCIGFRPAGAVLYSYACATSGDGAHMTCGALGDLDGDGERSLFVTGTAGPNGQLAAPPPDFGGLAPPCPLARPGEVVDCTPGVY